VGDFTYRASEASLTLCDGARAEMHGKCCGWDLESPGWAQQGRPPLMQRALASLLKTLPQAVLFKQGDFCLAWLLVCDLLVPA